MLPLTGKAKLSVGRSGWLPTTAGAPVLFAERKWCWFLAEWDVEQGKIGNGLRCQREGTDEGKEGAPAARWRPGGGQLAVPAAGQLPGRGGTCPPALCPFPSPAHSRALQDHQSLPHAKPTLKQAHTPPPSPSRPCPRAGATRRSLPAPARPSSAPPRSRSARGPRWRDPARWSRHWVSHLLLRARQRLLRKWPACCSCCVLAWPGRARNARRTPMGWPAASPATGAELPSPFDCMPEQPAAAVQPLSHAHLVPAHSSPALISN